jgi:putative Flp pilus-assembly TadE/G-like protein
MGLRQHRKNQRNGERGATLYIVAASLVILLGIAALAIDLASLYVAHNEAQRAADAAALAGAKVFVESGCVTNGNCSGEEGIASDRATQVAGQILVGGQAPTIQGITFNETPQDPQITVQVQSANLGVYFASAIGFSNATAVSASATAEAWNPSGGGGGATYCTGCLRPWLIPNGPTVLLNGNAVANPGCASAGGIVGQAADIQLATAPTQYGAIDVDNGIGNLGDYEQGIMTCSTGQKTCGGATFTMMPNLATTQAATVTAVENLLHVAATGITSQDTIDTTVCPPQIHAGALNPLVTNGVVAQGAVISTSDSIVTAYIYQPVTLNAPPTPTPVNIVGFAQIFVTQADPVNNGDVLGVFLGVAGCGSNAGGCNAGAIQGPTTLPVRLIQSGN